MAALLTVIVFSLPSFLLLLDVLAGGRRFSVSRYYVASWFGLTLALAWFTVEQAKRAFAGWRPVNLLAAAWTVAVAVLLAGSARAAAGMFRARQPDGKPDACYASAADAVVHSEKPILVNPGLVSTPLILSSALPAETPILNLRDFARMPMAELGRLAREHAVFLLRAPGTYHEPRRYEAAHIEREIVSSFRLSPSDPSACAARVLPVGEQP